MDSDVSDITWPSAWFAERDRYDALYYEELSLRRPHPDHPLLKTVAEVKPGNPQAAVQHDRNHYHIDARA